MPLPHISSDSAQPSLTQTLVDHAHHFSQFHRAGLHDVVQRLRNEFESETKGLDALLSHYPDNASGMHVIAARSQEGIHFFNPILATDEDGVERYGSLRISSLTRCTPLTHAQAKRLLEQVALDGPALLATPIHDAVCARRKELDDLLDVVKEMAQQLARHQRERGQASHEGADPYGEASHANQSHFAPIAEPRLQDRSRSMR